MPEETQGQCDDANGAKIPAIGLGTWQLNGGVGVAHHRAGAQASATGISTAR